MIDRSALNLSCVASRFPGNDGKPAHRSTLSRYVRQGVKLPSGERVYLKATRIGQRVFVMPEDLDAFIEAMNPGRPDIKAPTRTPSARRAATERACRELELMGA